MAGTSAGGAASVHAERVAAAVRRADATAVEECAREALLEAEADCAAGVERMLAANREGGVPAGLVLLASRVRPLKALLQPVPLAALEADDQGAAISLAQEHVMLPAAALFAKFAEAARSDAAAAGAELQAKADELLEDNATIYAGVWRVVQKKDAVLPTLWLP